MTFCVMCEYVQFLITVCNCGDTESACHSSDCATKPHSLSHYYIRHVRNPELGSSVGRASAS